MVEIRQALQYPICMLGMFALFCIPQVTGAETRGGKGETHIRPSASEYPAQITNAMGMKFVRIPPGNFMMGSPPSERGRDRDELQHPVTLSKAFYMQTTEVTQGQWVAIMGHNPSYFGRCGPDCPVERVSWYDVQRFIHRLNDRTKGKPYRLPTEAEWEYAARAGSRTALPTGDLSVTGCGLDANLHRIAWYCGNSAYMTHPVARKEPNAFGLYDMLGNVWEWCNDWYGDYTPESAMDPQGLEVGRIRVNRGGGHRDFSRFCRSANRLRYMPFDHTDDLGFRLVWVP